MFSQKNPSKETGQEKKESQALVNKDLTLFSADLIRTVAILLIILLHAAAFPPQIPTEITSQVMYGWITADVYSALGHMGVPLFVMLSGFFLLDASKADEPLRVFFRKRFNRVGLPFIFWSIVYFFWNSYVHGATLTFDTAVEAAFSGAYVHLWFLYLLVGLYLVTPLLRVLVKYLDWKRFKYLIILWFVGTVTVPLIIVLGGFNFNPVIFVFTGWMGYYLLGVFLQKIRVRKWFLGLAAVLGLTGAVLGAYVSTALIGERVTAFFHDSLSFNLIIASVSVYLLLTAVSPGKIVGRYGKVNSALHWIGQNTLPIYLMHYIILESLMFGFFGFTLNAEVLNPIIGIPLLTIVTFGLTALIVYPLKKVPFVKRLIG
ncbi:MAG: acyltransferase [Candidatus Bathyarchaeia archaeon]